MNSENEVIDLTDSFTDVGLNNHIPENSDEIAIVELDGTRYPSWKKIITSIRENNKHKGRPLISETETIEIIDTPIKSVKQSSSYGFGDCPICFEELGKKPLASTICGHIYCLKCLKLALNLSRKCPNCRRTLKRASDYHPLYLN